MEAQEEIFFINTLKSDGKKCTFRGKEQHKNHIINALVNIDLLEQSINMTVARFHRLSKATSDNSIFTGGSGSIDSRENHLRKLAKAASTNTILSSSKYTHPAEERRDILTVFEAEPLGYESSSGDFFPIEKLDFDAERNILEKSLEEATKVGAKIDVEYEPATIDRLGAFLDKGEGRVLHFSAHGHPKYLMIENGWGAGIPFSVEDLKRRISAGRNVLQFVFVSACHSNSAGNAFVEAGVPHVVCCEQDDQMLNTAAANVFAGAFYRALACGRTLRDAFESARNGFVQNGGEEMLKYALLPESGDHDVPIFFENDKYKPMPGFDDVPALPRAILPPAPDIFVGREHDMYTVLDALKQSRLVRVTGPRGVGKCSLAKAVTQYINKRHLMDDIIWVSDCQQETSESLVKYFSKLLEECWNTGSAFIFENNTTCHEYVQNIVNELFEKRALIIIDARPFQVYDEGIRKLCSFLESLFQQTKYAKVMFVHHYESEQIISDNFPVVEASLDLGQLDYEATVKLFCRLCQHSSSTSSELKSLLSLLVPPVGSNSNHKKVLSKRSTRIFKQLGEGYPAKIHRAAKSMTVSDYNKLYALGSADDFHATFTSRASLEEKLENLKEDVAKARMEEDYERAERIAASLDQLELLREELHDLVTLKRIAVNAEQDKRIAVDLENYTEAKVLQSELNSLKKKMKIEIEAILNQIIVQPEVCIDQSTLDIMVEELQINRKRAIKLENTSEEATLSRQLKMLNKYLEKRTTDKSSSDGGVADALSISNYKSTSYREVSSQNQTTRAGLEDGILELEKALKEALNDRNFRKVGSIDRRIEHLKSQRKTLPTSCEMESELKQLEAARENYILDHDWRELEVLDVKMMNIKRKLKLEKEVESNIQKIEDEQFDDEEELSICTSTKFGFIDIYSGEEVQMDMGFLNDNKESSRGTRQNLKRSRSMKEMISLEYKTRASLEEAIHQLEVSLAEHLSNREYRKVKHIDKGISRLKDLRRSLPTRNQLESELESLLFQQEELIHDHSWDDLEVLDDKLKEIEKKLNLEKHDERKIQPTGGQGVNASISRDLKELKDEGDSANKGCDPPGLHITEKTNGVRDTSSNVSSAAESSRSESASPETSSQSSGSASAAIVLHAEPVCQAQASVENAPSSVYVATVEDNPTVRTRQHRRRTPRHTAETHSSRTMSPRERPVSVALPTARYHGWNNLVFVPPESNDGSGNGIGGREYRRSSSDNGGHDRRQVYSAQGRDRDGCNSVNDADVIRRPTEGGGSNNYSETPQSSQEQEEITGGITACLVPEIQLAEVVENEYQLKKTRLKWKTFVPKSFRRKKH